MAISKKTTMNIVFIRNGLEEADWMDNATRRKAEEKVSLL